MPAEQSPENKPSRRGNADYRWAEFDSEAYFNHYYGEPHPDDDRVIECAVAAIRQAPPAGRDLDMVDAFLRTAAGAKPDRVGIRAEQRGLARG